jgi:hypothetical protein
VETQKPAKGILQAFTQVFSLLANNTEFSDAVRGQRLLGENGFGVAAPKFGWTRRQEQIGLNASSEPGNFAECIRNQSGLEKSSAL